MIERMARVEISVRLPARRRLSRVQARVLLRQQSLLPEVAVAADGERMAIPGGRWLQACCDCGLAHVLLIEATGDPDIMVVRAWRDPKVTQALRRQHAAEFTHKRAR